MSFDPKLNFSFYILNSYLLKHKFKNILKGFFVKYLIFPH